MKQRPEVKAFKNELGNYRYYQQRRESLEGFIEYCFHMLGGVRSPKLEPSGRSLPDKDHEYRIREEIDRHRRNLQITEDRIRSIEEVLERMPEDIRTAAVRIYADGESYEKVSMERCISAQGLNYQINKTIFSSIKKNDEVK